MKKRLAPLLMILALHMTPAFSHSVLVSSTPEANTILTEMPSSITLEFNEKLLVIDGKSGNQLEIEDPAGNSVPLEGVLVDGEKLRALVVEGDYAQGVYSIGYRAVSADGHVIEGKYPFTLGRTSIEPDESSNVAEPSSRVDQAIGLVIAASLVVAILTTLRQYRKRL